MVEPGETRVKSEEGEEQNVLQNSTKRKTDHTILFILGSTNTNMEN